MRRHTKTTALSSCPGALESIPLTTASSEGLNSSLVHCSEQLGSDCQVFGLEYLPYYRTSQTCVCPAPHTRTEGEKSFNEGKANSKQDENSISLSLELNRRTISSTSKEEPLAQQLLGASSPALCLPMASFSSRIPLLEQPFPSCGYFPYYRTEGGICTGPAQRNGSLTRMEGLEAKEGGQRGGSNLWNLRSSCLVS